MRSDANSRPAVALAALLGGTGVLHFAAPKPFDALIPRQLPGSPRTWTLGSGAAELAVAAAVATPRTRRIGGLAAALLFVAVFPGNVKMAVDYHRAGKPLPLRLAALARLPLQAPLVTWALHVRRSASRPRLDRRTND
jgi:uncharacterized membrane protein